jgi:hypothetical protein
MDHLKWAYLGYGMAWIATGIAIAVAVCVTNDMRCLWFLILPALQSVQASKKE